MAKRRQRKYQRSLIKLLQALGLLIPSHPPPDGVFPPPDGVSPLVVGQTGGSRCSEIALEELQVPPMAMLKT